MFDLRSAKSDENFPQDSSEHRDGSANQRDDRPEAAVPLSESLHEKVSW
jgi:hypothetical protein